MRRDASCLVREWHDSLCGVMQAVLSRSGKMKKKEMQMVLAFAAGMATMLALVVAWNLAAAPQYPNGYMMPMMRMVVGGLRSVDCDSLSESELENIGEQLMGQMVGDEIHEQMDQQMKDERTMHILMARMMTGCN